MNAGCFVIGLWLVAGWIVLPNAQAADDPPGQRTLAKGNFSRITEKQEVVIKEQKGWEAFWARHNVNTKLAAQIPKVDFEKEMVVAVALGQQRTGGYRIEITKVEAGPGRLRILYRRYAPPPDGINLQVITAPFHFVAVPKSELKPEFIEAQK